MKHKTHYCKICGKPVPTGLKKMYCSDECAREGKKRTLQAWKMAKKMAQAQDELTPKIIRVNTIELIAKAARDCGLSYGEYVARMDGLK